MISKGREPAAWEVIIEDDSFILQRLLIEGIDYYRFGYSTDKVFELASDWGELNPWRGRSGRGYVKRDILSMLRFFNKRGMKLSLETEMWMAKEKI